jgi:phage I-like protein
MFFVKKELEEKLGWLCLESFKLSESGEPLKETQIAKVGKFVHPKYGNFEITTDTLDQYVKHFDNGTLGREIMMNYEHGTTNKWATMSAGDFKSLVRRGDKLFAVIDWTDEARDLIKERKFKYISPEIFFNWVNEVGKAFKNIISGAALTNTPWFKGMAVVKASEVTVIDENKNKNDNPEVRPMNKTEALLCLSEHGINVVELQATVKKFGELRTKFSALEVKFNEVEGENKKLKSKCEAAEKASFNTKLSALIEKGMKDGKLTKAQAEGSFTELAEKMGLEFAERHLEELQKSVNLSVTKGSGKGNSENDKDTRAASEQLVDKANALATEKSISFNEALDAVIATDQSIMDNYDKELAQMKEA